MSELKAFLTAMRIYQWPKNGLVFVPLIASHTYTDPHRVILSLLAFFVFSLTASSGYVFNDLMDISHDRSHERKRFRPFASGKLNVGAGRIVWPVLAVSAAMVSWWWLPAFFLLNLAAYFVLTLAYSLRLKQMAVMDVVVLAVLYTLRVSGGAAAIAVPLSYWLLLFSMFLFFSLALIKRYNELKTAAEAGRTGALRGRGYRPDDVRYVAWLGGSAGCAAVVILALYLLNAQAATIYVMPQVLWLICPVLLLWIARVWLIAYRGYMQDDPIVFALKDKVSWAVAVLLLAVLVWADYPR